MREGEIRGKSNVSQKTEIRSERGERPIKTGQDVENEGEKY